MPRNGGSGGGAAGGSSGLDCGGSSNGSGKSTSTKVFQTMEQAIMGDGVTFDVRYIGCLEIKSSMKTLEFATRSHVAKECINRVCEAAGLKTSKKRRVDKKVLQCISDTPHMKNAGTNVTLTVSSKSLTLVSHENGDIIAEHEMPRISFASGGDTTTLDFVAYVAKDLQECRACFVLECGGGQAQDLIATIGHAFELRYREFFNKKLEYKDGGDSPYNFRCDKDYYNDLPGKVPPDLLCDNEQPHAGGGGDGAGGAVGGGGLALSSLRSGAPGHLNIRRERINSNLIDLNSPTATNVEHDYVNEKLGHIDSADNTSTSTATAVSTSSNSIFRDVFDMQPFSLSAEVQKSQLMTESWYHGGISRPTSEGLLKNDGDFLVRESQGTPGQYVLSGMQSTSPKHLLLIDPEGIVRTKDRVFESISHLINYHWTNGLPIISAESALLLRTPIIRTNDLK